MEEFIPFSDEHVGEVADLYLIAVRGQNRPAPEYLREYFREVFFRNPWVTPDIPSRVYVKDGRVLGFVGVIPRLMECRNKPIRVAAISPFMVDPRQNTGIAGLKLLRQVFTGPQDLSFTDGAANEASAVFTAAGAKVVSLYSFNWIRLLRPFETVRSGLSQSASLRHLYGPAGLVTRPLDWLASKAPVSLLRKPVSRLVPETVSVKTLFDCMQESRSREAIRPVRDAESLAWLLHQAGLGPGHAGLRSVVVSTPDGVRCGWFVYYAQPGKACSVLQVASLRKQQFGEVFGALLEDAWNQGLAAIKGQAIPQHLVTLTEQNCIFRQPYACVVGHASDPELMAAFQSGDTSISRLDAGSWLRFSADSWA